MELYGQLEAQLCSLSSALNDSDWLASRPGHSNLGENPSVPTD
jgi:hypothetical protein